MIKMQHDNIKSLLSLAENKLNDLSCLLACVTSICNNTANQEPEAILHNLDKQKQYMLSIHNVDKEYNDLLQSFPADIRSFLSAMPPQDFNIDNNQPQWYFDIYSLLKKQHEILLKISDKNKEATTITKNITSELKGKIKYINQQKNLIHNYNFHDEHLHGIIFDYK